MDDDVVPAIAGYRDLARVAAGGFSTVYRAHQERFDRTVAVKVLDIDDLDAEGQRRFAAECQAAGRVSRHPNIVTVLDSGFTEDGRPYIAQELMSSGSLGDRLARSGPLPLADVLAIGVKMSGALAAAHQAGITHRDVKPDNILLSEYGDVELADFGISAADDQREEEGGSIAVTPVHAAPELFEGAHATATTDVYALASTLYALAVGRAPFEHPGDDLTAIVRRAHRDEVPEPRQPKLPDAFLAVVRKAMAKDPAARYASAIELGEALRAIERAQNLTVTRLPLADENAAIAGGAAERRGGRVTGMVAAVAVVLLLVAVAALALRPSGQETAVVLSGASGTLAATTAVTQPAATAPPSTEATTTSTESTTTTAPPTTPPVTPAPTFAPVTTRAPVTVPPTTPAPTFAVTTTPTVAQKPAPVPIATSQLSAVEQELLGRLNQVRAGAGQTAVTPERYLQQFATSNSQRMASGGGTNPPGNLLDLIGAQYQAVYYVPLRSTVNDTVNNAMTLIQGNAQYQGQVTLPATLIGVSAVQGGGFTYITIVLGY